MTKVEIHQSTTEKLLDCMSFGDDGYVNYVQSRLVDKDTPLQAPIRSLPIEVILKGFQSHLRRKQRF